MNWALGYPDGEKIGRQTMLEAVRRIAGGVSVPVTADMVAGFGATPEDVAETVRGIIEVGAVGFNMEDSTGDPQNPLFEISLQVEKIRAAREAAMTAGVPVVINARTDVFLAAVGAADTRLDHAVRRANAYRDASADCLFVPGVQDSVTIAQLARTITGPLNILVRASSPPIPELARLEWRGSASALAPCSPRSAGSGESRVSYWGRGRSRP